MRIDDRLFGVLICLLGIFTLWYSAGFPPVAKQFYGPAMFPTVIGWAFVASGLVLVVSAFRKAQKVEGLIAFPDWRGAPRGVASVVLMLVSIPAFVYLGDVVGFQVLAFVTLALMYIAAGRGIATSLAVALLVTVALDLLFRKLLRVPLPGGLLADMPW